jgi:hypothetical protein
MSSEMKTHPRNWTRDSRKSGPAGIPTSSALLMPPRNASIDVRDRYAVTKSTKKLNTELAQQYVDRDDKRRRASRSVRTISSRGDEEEDPYSPFTRKPSHRFTRMGTGDFVDEDENDSDSSYNSFNLSLQKKALFAVDTSALLAVPTHELSRSLSAGSTKGESSAERDKIVQVYRVYRSRYEGNQFADGNLSIQLTTGTNHKMFQRELSKPLFRWMHVENQQMNFNLFQNNALDCPWLSDTEKQSLISILKVSRQKSDRSLRIPQGKTGSYVEPEYYEERIEQTVLKGFRSRRQKTEIIRWMCLPYFVVGEPTRLTKKQLRDRRFQIPDTTMTSAFLSSGYINEGKHFQVAQVWCVCVGDSLLMSSTRRPIADIPGNQIHVRSSPPANPELRESGDRAPVMIVSDGGIRTWLLPVNECQTWPEFAAHFAELGVDFSENWNLLYKDTKLTRKDWPRVMTIAKKSSIRLELQKSTATDDDDYDSDESSVFNSNIFTAKEPSVSSPDSQDIPIVTGAPFSADPADSWYVFTLLATQVTEQTAQPLEKEEDSPARSLSQQVLNLDDRVLKDDCDEADLYLTNENKRNGESEAYIHCPMMTFNEVREFAVSLIPKDGTKPSGMVSMQLHFMKAVCNIFTFFYPLHYDHTITRKFWGAVDRLLRNEYTPAVPERFATYVQDIRRLSHVVEDVKEELFSKRSPAHNHTSVPHEFLQAWILCLMYFVLWGGEDASRSRNYLKRCRTLLTQGKIKVIQRLRIISLRDREAVSPMGVSSLLIGQLLQDVHGGPLFFDRHRLATLYWKDIQDLVSVQNCYFILYKLLIY